MVAVFLILFIGFFVQFVIFRSSGALAVYATRTMKQVEARQKEITTADDKAREEARKAMNCPYFFEHEFDRKLIEQGIAGVVLNTCDNYACEECVPIREEQNKAERKAKAAAYFEIQERRERRNAEIERKEAEYRAYLKRKNELYNKKFDRGPRKHWNSRARLQDGTVFSAVDCPDGDYYLSSSGLTYHLRVRNNLVKIVDAK